MPSTTTASTLHWQTCEASLTDPASARAGGATRRRHGSVARASDLVTITAPVEIAGYLRLMMQVAKTTANNGHSHAEATLKQSDAIASSALGDHPDRGWPPASTSQTPEA